MKKYDKLPSEISPDLSLPDWGPYSKRFFGVSRIADPNAGTRFDFTVIPGIYRREFGIPDALRPSGYLPWNVTSDLTGYSYRQQLQWKDRLYCDISFIPADGDSRFMECRFINHTDLPTACSLHLISSLVPEPTETVRTDAEYTCRPTLNSGRGLVFDARHPGEERMNGTLTGSAYQVESGEKVCFELPEIHGKTLYLRTRQQAATLLNGKLELPASENQWILTTVFQGDFPGGTLCFVPDKPILVDRMYQTSGKEPEIRPFCCSKEPIFDVDSPDLLIWHYEGTNRFWGLKADRPFTFRRRYAVQDFMKTLLYEDGVHQPFLNWFGDCGGPDRHLDAVLQPIDLPAGSETVIDALIASDLSCENLKKRMSAIDLLCADSHIRKKEKEYVRMGHSPYEFSQERMAAVTLTNLVYPTWFRDVYAKHHTPGRRWNSLYTWDSGFIGLGLMEIDLLRAIENLNAYLTPVDDPDNAFVLHGSPVPVQIYLLFELWNRTGNLDLLRHFYPRARRYYRYLAGHEPGSLTRTHSKEPLICTWDYFYNSGGWDDYPPQHEVHRIKDYRIIPAVGNAHLIRCAKMMTHLAEELGEDTADYARDIRDFSDALQQYSWDPESGYFSYVKHDSEGNPTGIFRAPDGSNYNMGLDGAMPLAAGAVTPEQREILWARLRTPGRIWSPCGLSTVDQSASYYRKDGYWNGAVWMPYQWLFWKAALNDGMSDFAWQIAETALTLWEREVQASYACYEQFPIESGRGGGWHHFSALSAPVLNWNAAYYTRGTFNAGYDVRFRDVHIHTSGLDAELVIHGDPGEKTTILLVLDPGKTYQATYDGMKYSVRTRAERAYEIDLPKSTRGTLILKKI